MGNPGSIHNTWIPKLGRTLAFLGILSREVDQAEWRVCVFPWRFTSPSHRQHMVTLGPLPELYLCQGQTACSRAGSFPNKKCSGTEEKQHLHVITTRFHGLSLLLEERSLSPGSLYTTGDMQILTPTHSLCSPNKHGLHCEYRNCLRITVITHWGFQQQETHSQHTHINSHRSLQLKKAPQGQASTLTPNSFLHKNL